MAITERAINLATMPLRLVQQAAGNDTEATRRTEQGIDQVRADLDQVRAEVAGVREEVTRLRSELAGLGELAGDLEATRKQIRSLRNKVNAVHEDTQHIRTEQASGAAAKGS